MRGDVVGNAESEAAVRVRLALDGDQQQLAQILGHGVLHGGDGAGDVLRRVARGEEAGPHEAGDAREREGQLLVKAGLAEHVEELDDFAQPLRVVLVEALADVGADDDELGVVGGDADGGRCVLRLVVRPQQK